MGLQRILMIIGLATLAVVAGLWLQLRMSAPAVPPETNATLLRTARPIEDVRLQDTLGNEFRIQQLQGRWSLVFFGFTHCPDVCPTTLTILGQVAKGLSDLPETRQPRLVFVTVDPERDVPAVIKGYVEHFDKNMIGLTGELAQIEALAAQLGVAFQKVPLDQGGYSMDHSAAILLLNPGAELNAIISAPHTVEGISEDYRKIVEFMDEQS
ncbi:MAG: SCO family protein [Chromatiales bacterium]|nr:SCO family protein [Chromatiales bacterium]